MTVAELREWLKSFPPDAGVTGYDGEGGSWIVVEKDNIQIAEVCTNKEGMFFIRMPTNKR